MNEDLFQNKDWPFKDALCLLEQSHDVDHMLKSMDFESLGERLYDKYNISESVDDISTGDFLDALTKQVHPNVITLESLNNEMTNYYRSYIRQLELEKSYMIDYYKSEQEKKENKMSLLHDTINDQNDMITKFSDQIKCYQDEIDVLKKQNTNDLTLCENLKEKYESRVFTLVRRIQILENNCQFMKNQLLNLCRNNFVEKITIESIEDNDVEKHKHDYTTNDLLFSPSLCLKDTQSLNHILDMPKNPNEIIQYHNDVLVKTNNFLLIQSQRIYIPPSSTPLDCSINNSTQSIATNISPQNFMYIKEKYDLLEKKLMESDSIRDQLEHILYKKLDQIEKQHGVQLTDMISSSRQSNFIKHQKLLYTIVSNVVLKRTINRLIFSNTNLHILKQKNRLKISNESTFSISSSILPVIEIEENHYIIPKKLFSIKHEPIEIVTSIENDYSTCNLSDKYLDRFVQTESVSFPTITKCAVPILKSKLRSSLGEESRQIPVSGRELESGIKLSLTPNLELESGVKLGLTPNSELESGLKLSSTPNSELESELKLGSTPNSELESGLKLEQSSVHDTSLMKNNKMNSSELRELSYHQPSVKYSYADHKLKYPINIDQSIPSYFKRKTSCEKSFNKMSVTPHNKGKNFFCSKTLSLDLLNYNSIHDPKNVFRKLWKNIAATTNSIGIPQSDDSKLLEYRQKNSNNSDHAKSCLSSYYSTYSNIFTKTHGILVKNRLVNSTGQCNLIHSKSLTPIETDTTFIRKSQEFKNSSPSYSDTNFLVPNDKPFNYSKAYMCHSNPLHLNLNKKNQYPYKYDKSVRNYSSDLTISSKYADSDTEDCNSSKKKQSLLQLALEALEINNIDDLRNIKSRSLEKRR